MDLTKKIAYVASMAVGLIAIIVLPIVLSPIWPIANNGPLAIYLAAKIVFGLAFLFASVYPLLKKENATGITFLFDLLVVVLQFVPLALRGIAQALPDNVLWPTILFLFGLLLFIGLGSGLLLSNEKMLAANKKAEGHAIDIHEEK
jgi:hypothetical protein